MLTESRHARDDLRLPLYEGYPACLVMAAVGTAEVRERARRDWLSQRAKGTLQRQECARDGRTLKGPLSIRTQNDAVQPSPRNVALIFD